MKPNQRATVITLLERSTPQLEIAHITGIDRKTIRSYHARWLLDPSNFPGVATGSEVAVTQIPPPWPPAPACTSCSLCEYHRDFIEAQLLLPLPNRLVFSLMAFLLLCSMSIAAWATPPNSGQLYQRIRPSVVEVITLNRTNLGVSSMDNGFMTHLKDWVITNDHVVGDSTFELDEHDLRIVAMDQGRLKAEIVAVDIQNDLAILKIEQALRVPLLPLRESLPDRGESGYSMGKPGSYQYSIGTGTFNGVNRFKSWTKEKPNLSKKIIGLHQVSEQTLAQYWKNH